MFKRFTEREIESATRLRLKPEPRRVLRCCRCDNEVTGTDQRIQKRGAHTHRFVNPHGLHFEIGCFRIARGCVHMGQPTAEHSWFPGYVWRIALCSRCQNHLGWLFQGDGEGFYGLILAQLRETG